MVLKKKNKVSEKISQCWQRILKWHFMRKCTQVFHLIQRVLSKLFLPLAWVWSVLVLSVGTGLFRLLYRSPLVYKEPDRFLKEEKPFLRFKKISTIIYIAIGVEVILFFFACYLTNILRSLIGFIYYVGSTFLQDTPVPKFPLEIFDVRNFLEVNLVGNAPIIFVPVFLILTILNIRANRANFHQYRDFNHHEHGNDYFLDEKGVKRNYKKIPNKTLSFPGYGGVPVAHFMKKDFSKSFLSIQALKTKMMWHFPKYDKRDAWQKKLLAKIGQSFTKAEKCLHLVKQVTGYYYIVEDTVNTLLVGMTRSGKGETFINVLIDILSRARKKCSLVIADPKGELFQMSFKTLVKRGYNVLVLNFLNMDLSMSYNPLALASEYAKKGYFDKTQEQVKNVAEAIYRKSNNSDGNAKYWEDTSISLFQAIAMALIWRASLTEEWETITLRNLVEFLTNLGSEDVYVKNGAITQSPKGAEKKSKLTVYFDFLRELNKTEPNPFLVMADNAFRVSNFSSEETQGNIYSSMLSGVELYLTDNIAKLTSKNSIDLRSVGFPRRLSIHVNSYNDEETENENPFLHQTCELRFTSMQGKLLEKGTAIVDSAGYITYCIEPTLPKKCQLEVTFQHENNDLPTRFQEEKLCFTVERGFKKEKVYHSFLKREVEKTVKDKQGKKIEEVKLTLNRNDETPLIAVGDMELVYSEKPTAVFLVIPPNKPEYGVMVSFFVDQLFNANVDLASVCGRKLHHRIHHIFDEFGNYPRIPNMDTKISIGLGYQILYDIALQNLKQLDKIYGAEVATTIRGNCSIQEYIKSNDKTTLEEFSFLAGKKTILNRSKSNDPTSNGIPSESYMEQPLVTTNQLQKLQAGEALIIVGVKAETNLGQKTTNHPILVKGKMEFPYRYMFLFEEFDQSMTLSDIPVVSEHRGMDLKDVSFEYTSYFRSLDEYVKSKKETSLTSCSPTILHRFAGREKEGFVAPMDEIPEGLENFRHTKLKSA